MQAEETTLPSPDRAGGTAPVPYGDDKELISRLDAGLVASGAKTDTKATHLLGLTAFSDWLRQVGKDAIWGRLFTEDLTTDVHKFIRKGGHHAAAAALAHLRNMESSTHGTTQISTLEVRREKEVPDVDRLLIDLAFGGSALASQAIPSQKISTETAYRLAMLSFSEWLASMGQPRLAEPNALHSPQMTNLASQYASMRLPYGHNVNSALAQLRRFDLTGETNIKRRRNVLNIPEADQRLIERFLAQGNAWLEAEARQTHQSIRDKKGRTKYDRYAIALRTLSAWLQAQNMRNIASRLDDDFQSLLDDVRDFGHGQKRNSTDAHRTGLRQMAAMLSKAPEVTMARIEPNRFVNALGMFMANVSLAEVARRTDTDEGDLRVFLDERSATGLTQAGQAAVSLFEGRLRRAADANIALRVQSWGQAAQHTGQMPTQTPSPYHLSPVSPSGFPSFGWSDEPSGYSQHGGSVGSVQRGTDPAYEGLSPLNSAAYSGGHGFDLNTPSVEAAQQAGTPSEVTGPSQPRQPLSPGPMLGSLRSALSQQNLEPGFGSGDALNCLIDTALQLSTGVRRPDNGHTPMHELDHTVPQWRQYLFAAGIVPQHGMIDLYSATLAGQDLAHNLGVRIQIIQWENGGVTAHPVLGRQGPLMHILHTPGHFQPLWPRNG
jgi:hypothetical protein